LLEDYKEYTIFFTDGSKTDKRVGASVIYKENKIMIKIPNSCTISSAEAIAISHSLDIIKQNKITKSIILSDSLSTLTNIQNYLQPNDISRKIQNQISSLELQSQSITMNWMPNHFGIQGNELADTYAKQAITSPDAHQINIHTLQDSKNIINKSITNQWQQIWQIMHTKLNEITPSIYPWPVTSLPRRQEVILNRLRIGHTWLTHRHFMNRTDPALCPTCGVTLTVKHGICNCLKYRDIKDSLEISDNFQQALSPDPENVYKIFKFLKLTKMYNLI
jgi:ribonuclease HI